MEENKQRKTGLNINKKISPDALKKIIIGLVSLVVIVFVFGAGVLLGEMKAHFSYRWAENYHKNFAGPRQGFMDDWQRMPPKPGDFIESHGTFGEIIKINNSDFVIKGNADVEKMIVITEKTVIERGRETIKKEDLKVGDQVVVIGSPTDQGQIEAKLIRVF